jgi:FkbM family methyltransferase
LTITDDVHVTYPAGEERYILASPGDPVELHARKEGLPSEYRATRSLWNRDGRTILLLGDTYFTDDAIRKVETFAARKYQGFGRHGKSNITGCRYGELFAASWWPEQFEKMEEYLKIIEGHHARGTITRPTGWMLLRAWQGTPLNKHRTEPEWMTTIDDLTDDWDFPVDYETHPVIAKETKMYEAGKGHAARNAAFPRLLARLGVEARHVVHVGAHDGEEMPYYESAKFEKITLVEPDPALAHQLRAKWPYVEVIEAAVGLRKHDAVPLYVMPVSNMNTVIATGLDAPKSIVNVKMVRLRDIAKDANVAVIDVQGAELDVLKGADLTRFDLVLVETSTVPDTTMASTYSDVTDYMISQGYEVVEYWTRDYQWVAKWGRKRHHKDVGEVRDVVYARVKTPPVEPIPDTAGPSDEELSLPAEVADDRDGTWSLPVAVEGDNTQKESPAVGE